ncbi:SGNH/GDSL hydrolase family protein [Bacillus sp. 7894-2]|uniref:SGNH/GDSL hydrolase family protein n=1 Tax=Bacillus sp. 7894-2 TaxID=2021695 RepID=UPI000BA51C58|nr:SGNH/GDSL hydrolase family protein [Bacillus sp. 7894-2]PAE25778.1 hypothetical protein CHI10_05710 [Bacillus sp. 7894-2]
MNKLLIILLAISCGVVLYIGNAHWKEKTVHSTETEKQTKTAAKAESSSEKDKSAEKISIDEFTKLSQNWPEEAKRRFQQTFLEEIPYKIVIVGSSAIGTETEGWAYLTKQKLEETYGDFIEVDIQTFDGTSMQFSSENDVSKIIEEKADLILLEPFTLKDNGEVIIEDSHANISNWMESVQADNPDTVFILQPPNPIHDASYYPLQVEELKKYAEANNIPYLDHWTAWPDPQSGEIIPYLSEDNEIPSEQGHQLWSDFITDYFINK